MGPATKIARRSWMHERTCDGKAGPPDYARRASKTTSAITPKSTRSPRSQPLPIIPPPIIPPIIEPCVRKPMSNRMSTRAPTPARIRIAGFVRFPSTTDPPFCRPQTSEPAQWPDATSTWISLQDPADLGPPFASYLSSCGSGAICPGKGALGRSELALDSFVGESGRIQLHSRSAELPLPASAFLHQEEDHWRDEQDVDGGSDHSPHDRCRDRAHDFGARARRPEDGDQRQGGRGDRHQFRPQAQNRSFARRLEDDLASRLSPGEPLVECLVQVDHHDDAGLDGDAVKRDVADPDGHGEVVAEKPLENDSSRHRVDHRKHHDRGLGSGAEGHRQKKKDRGENDWQDDLQCLASVDLELVLAGPVERDPGRK